MVIFSFYAFEAKFILESLAVCLVFGELRQFIVSCTHNHIKCAQQHPLWTSFEAISGFHFRFVAFYVTSIYNLNSLYIFSLERPEMNRKIYVHW